MAPPHPWGDLPPPLPPPLTQGSDPKVCPSLGIRHTLQPLILILVSAAAFKEIISLKIIEGKCPTLRHLNLFYSLKKKADSLKGPDFRTTSDFGYLRKFEARFESVLGDQVRS